MKRVELVVVTGMLAALAACSGNEDPGGSSEPPPSTATSPATSATPTPSAEPSEDAPETVAPNVGADALRVGEWREGVGVRTIVLSVDQAGDAPRPAYLANNDTGEGALVVAKVCVRKDASGPTWAMSYDFVGVDADGGEYTVAGNSWSDWPPAPQFPSERQVPPGGCVKGSLLLTVDSGTKLDRIRAVSSDGSPFAEWVID